MLFSQFANSGFDGDLLVDNVKPALHKKYSKLCILSQEYLKELSKKKSVIVCGDLNVAHKEIDLKNPKTNRKNAGFTDEERNKFTELLDSGFIDTYRYL